MARVIHTMIRVRDEAQSVAFYRTAFGFQIAKRVDFDGFTLVYLRNAETDFEIELTINRDRETPYEMGDGYGHLAVTVVDLDAEHTRMTLAGLEPTPIRSLNHESNLLARFFFVTDPDGYKTETLQRFGRYQ